MRDFRDPEKSSISRCRRNALHPQHHTRFLPAEILITTVPASASKRPWSVGASFHLDRAVQPVKPLSGASAFSFAHLPQTQIRKPVRASGRPLGAPGPARVSLRRARGPIPVVPVCISESDLYRISDGTNESLDRCCGTARRSRRPCAQSCAGFAGAQPIGAA